MAAIFAAIGAAFLAGAIALYREFRQEQRRLLVAARVIHENFGVASLAINASVETNGWAPFNAMPDETSFWAAWDSYKGDLAGHLTWSEWLNVEAAVTQYLALRNMAQNKLPQAVGGVVSRIEETLEEGQEVLRPYCISRSSVWTQIRRRLARLRSGR